MGEHARMARTTPERPVDPEALFPELSAFRRTATRLHPRPGRPGVGDSSIGGPLLWPADEPWPTCAEPHGRDGGVYVQDVRASRRILAEAWGRTPGPGERAGPTDEELRLLESLDRELDGSGQESTDPIPMMAVAQLYRRDVPDLVGGPEDCDLLQILWCPFDAHGGGFEMSLILRWRRSAEVTDVSGGREPRVVGSEGYVPEPCVLSPERVVEHQYVELLPGPLRERIEEWEEDDDEDEELPLYSSDLSTAPGWKVGGFVSWNLTGPPESMSCACGLPMEPLVTIASSEWNGGNRSWVPVEDRAIVNAHGACTPTEVTVGRWGTLYVLTCTGDPAHPHWLSIQ